MTWRKRLTRFRKEAIRRCRATPTGRAMLSAAAVAKEPLDYYQRRRTAVRYNQRYPSNCMPAEEGYVLLPAGSLPGTPEIIDTCRRLFIVKKAALEAAARTGEAAIRQPSPGPLSRQRKDAIRQQRREAIRRQRHEARREQRTKQGFLWDLLDNDDLRANPELVDFALSDPLFSIVTDYLGVIPSLTHIDLVYSIPRLTPDEHIASQLFHQDPEGLTQAKVFLNVFDVDDAHGPLTFIPARQSERMVTAIQQHRRHSGARDEYRYSDEEVNAYGGAGATVRLTGPAGTAAIVDTSRCIHAGSRLRPGYFRLCLFLQYCTSRQKGHTFDARRFRNDPVRWLAVKRSAAAG